MFWFRPVKLHQQGWGSPSLRSDERSLQTLLYFFCIGCGGTHFTSQLSPSCRFSPPPCPPPCPPILPSLSNHLFPSIKPSQGNPGMHSMYTGFPSLGRNTAGRCVLGLGLSSPGLVCLLLRLSRTEYPICMVGERPGPRRTGETGEALLAQELLWPLPPGQGARGAQLPRVHKNKYFGE